MSFGAVIDYFRRPAPFTVTRRGAGTYDANGIAVAASSSTFSIVAVLQPLRGRVLDALPSGQRGADERLMHTETALRARDSNGACDTVSIDSEEWIVVECQPWTHPAGGTFYRVRVVREANP